MSVDVEITVRDWRHHGACVGEDPEIMFPLAEQDPAALPNAGERKALRVCAGCPVVAQCREWALGEDGAPGEDAGVWGGLTESARRRIRSTALQRRRAASRPARRPADNRPPSRTVPVPRGVRKPPKKTTRPAPPPVRTGTCGRCDRKVAYIKYGSGQRAPHGCLVSTARGLCRNCVQLSKKDGTYENYSVRRPERSA